MTMEQYLAICPRHFGALSHAYERKTELARLSAGAMVSQLGHLIAMVGNTGFKGFEGQLDPLDYMPRKKRMSRKALDKELRDTMNWYRQNGRGS
jgi:hypothetical protein